MALIKLEMLALGRLFLVPAIKVHVGVVRVWHVLFYPATRRLLADVIAADI
jgi:hypothetical protein